MRRLARRQPRFTPQHAHSMRTCHTRAHAAPLRLHRRRLRRVLCGMSAAQPSAAALTLPPGAQGTCDQFSIGKGLSFPAGSKVRSPRRATPGRAARAHRPLQPPRAACVR